MSDPHRTVAYPVDDNPWGLTLAELAPPNATVLVDRHGLQHAPSCTTGRNRSDDEATTGITTRQWLNNCASCCNHESRMWAHPNQPNPHTALRMATDVHDLANQLEAHRGDPHATHDTRPASGSDLPTGLLDPTVGWQIRSMIHDDMRVPANSPQRDPAGNPGRLNGPTAALYRQLSGAVWTLERLNNWLPDPAAGALGDTLPSQLARGIRTFRQHGGLQMAARQAAVASAYPQMSHHLVGALHGYLLRLQPALEFDVALDDLRTISDMTLAKLRSGLNPTPPTTTSTRLTAPQRHLRDVLEPALLALLDQMLVIPAAHQPADQLVCNVAANSLNIACMWNLDMADVAVPVARTRLHLVPSYQAALLRTTASGVPLGTAPDWLTRLQPEAADELLATATQVHGDMGRHFATKSTIPDDVTAALTSAAHALNVPTA